MAEYKIRGPYDVPTIFIPTANNDIWSRRDGFIGQPTTFHEHVAFTRGDEFNGGYCLGNSSYAPAGVGDAHEMRDFGFNFASGEHRQLCMEWGPLHADDPLTTLGTEQVFEIKTGWQFRGAETSTVAGFPAGFQTGYWHWGMGLQWQSDNDLVLDTNFLTLNFFNGSSQTHLRAEVGNTFGNVFQGGTILSATPYSYVPLDADIGDLRLQVVAVVREKHGDPDTWVEVYDHWVGIIGPEGWRAEDFTYIGQIVTEVGNINPRKGHVFKPRRINKLWLGSSFIQNRALNGVRYQTTRYWSLLSYIWNPVENGTAFIWDY